MFVTNWISTTKIQKISEITNFFRHYFLSRTEVIMNFTPPNEIPSMESAISSLVVCGWAIMYLRTSACIGSNAFRIVLLSFWVVISIFGIVLLSFWIVLGIITLNSFPFTSFSNRISGYSARIRTIPDNYVYFYSVSSHQASQRSSNAWGFFIYIRWPQKFSEVTKHYISFNLFNYRLLYSFIN